jgi:hydrophobic/amphiphilic exporter-1 (mainly G- bacteria), HAE1 family
MSITEISIKRPTLIIVIFIVLGVLGFFSYTQLKYELMPDITPPYVTVTTVYAGASPQEIENSVTKPIEDAISNVSKIKHISSYSSEGVSMIFMEFLQSADGDIAVADVQRSINEILNTLPDDSKTPIISKFSLRSLPILRIGTIAEMQEKDFYNFMKETVKPRISKLKGVGQVTLVGGNEREIKVNLSLEKLNSYNLSILQVTQSVKNSNYDFPAGKIKDADGQYIVRIAGKFSSIEELRSLIISRTPGGSNVKLGDVAEIEDGEKEVTTISRINGKSAIGVLIQNQLGTNAVEVSRLVRVELEKITRDYKDKKIKFDIAQDSSVFTIQSAKAVAEDLTLAIFLVALVMLVFLHSIRNSLIIMLAIPCSLVTTFVGIYAFNFTLNLMTLLALSLVIGILVDDSIVVLENIYRHLEMGKDRRAASLEGRNEIGFSALSITLVDVVVFLPLALIQGMIGNIVRQYALVVVISTLVSLFVSFTMTPMLASRFGKLENFSGHQSILGVFGKWFEGGFKKLVDLYGRILEWSLMHKKFVVGLAAGLFIVSIALVPLGFIGSEFMTPTDRGELSVQLELPERATLEETNRISQEVEQIFVKMPVIDKVFVNAGASSDGFIGE